MAQHKRMILIGQNSPGHKQELKDEQSYRLTDTINEKLLDRIQTKYKGTDLSTNVVGRKIRLGIAVRPMSFSHSHKPKDRGSFCLVCRKSET